MPRTPKTPPMTLKAAIAALAAERAARAEAEATVAKATEKVEKLTATVKELKAASDAKEIEAWRVKEAHHKHLEDLRRDLLENYARVGVARGDLFALWDEVEPLLDLVPADQTAAVAKVRATRRALSTMTRETHNRAGKLLEHPAFPMALDRWIQCGSSYLTIPQWLLVGAAMMLGTFALIQKMGRAPSPGATPPAAPPAPTP